MFQRDRSQDLLLSEVSVCVPLPMTVTVGPMAISWQFPSATLPVLEVILNTTLKVMITTVHGNGH